MQGFRRVVIEPDEAECEDGVVEGDGAGFWRIRGEVRKEGLIVFVEGALLGEVGKEESRGLRLELSRKSVDVAGEVLLVGIETDWKTFLGCSSDRAGKVLVWWFGVGVVKSANTLHFACYLLCLVKEHHVHGVAIATALSLCFLAVEAYSWPLIAADLPFATC